MKRKKEKQFLEQLKTIPNISLACEKVGLSRNTVYRWCKEDPDFKKQMDEALTTGVDSVNDLAESKLITHLNSGNMQAIRYWLDNNKKNYVKPRPVGLWEALRDNNDVREIKITLLNPTKGKASTEELETP